MLALCVCIYVVWTDQEGRHHPRLLTGKCRVSPLLGTTIPRGELQAIVVLHRLVATVIEAFPYKFKSVSTYTDSLCSLGAINKSTAALRPFFANRVLEILRLREQIKLSTDELAPVSHIPGENNPADVGTRGLMSVGDLGKDSFWQVGPDFLGQDYATWPQSRPADLEHVSVPVEEGRSLFGAQETKEPQDRSNPIEKMMTEVSGETALGKLIQGLCDHVLAKEKLELSVRVLARVLQGVLGGRREACSREPSSQAGRDCRPPSHQAVFKIVCQSPSRWQASGSRSGKPWWSGMGHWAHQRRTAGHHTGITGAASPASKREASLLNNPQGTPRGPPSGTPRCDSQIQEVSLDRIRHAPSQDSGRPMLRL